jgi:hypothetical protein
MGGKRKGKWVRHIVEEKTNGMMIIPLMFLRKKNSLSVKINEKR